jgi:mannosylglycerate hydrolase
MPDPPASVDVLVVPHTHWDREWYAPFQVYRRALVACLSDLLDRLDADPSAPAFTLDGQVVLLEDYLEVHPEDEWRVREHVQSGRLLIGPAYVQGDEFLVSGEAIIRNLLVGRAVAARFGETMQVGYFPDTFGHIAQLPQLLRGFGLDSVIFSRGMGDEGERLGSEFTWRAPDGSAVLAIHQLGGVLDRTSGYLNAALLGYLHLWGDDHGPFSLECARDHAKLLAERLLRYARTPFLLFSNGGDHLCLQPELQQVLRFLNSSLPSLRFTCGTFQQYVERVASAARELACWQGELRGARYNHVLSGVLSTRTPLKQANARAQVELERWAEPFGALGHLEGGDDPQPFLRLAWRLLLLNHAHDSICGCSVDQVHREMEPRFDQVQQIAAGIEDAGIASLLGQSRTLDLPHGPLVTVLNPCGGTRTEAVAGTVHLPETYHDVPLVALDAYGNRAPCQILARHTDSAGGSGGVGAARIAIVARDVPSLGYQTLSVQPGTASPVEQRYELEVSDDGRLRITHRASGHVIRGAHLLVDEADAGDEYTYSPCQLAGAPITSAEAPARTSLVHSGSVVTTFGIEQVLLVPDALADDRQTRSVERVPLRVYSEVSLAADSPWVDIQTTVDNTASDHRLRVLCPTGLHATDVEALGHFDRLRRPVTRPPHPGWLETWDSTGHQQGYVCVSSDRIGVALLSPELPEYLAEVGQDGVALSLTLLRCVGWLSRSDLITRPTAAGPSLATPDAQCPGRHTFRYAIAVFTPDERAQLPAWAERYRAPMRLTAARRQDGALPAQLSLVDVEAPAVLSSVKLAEDGNGLIVRVYNPRADVLTTQVRAYRSAAQAWACRLDETPIALLPVSSGGDVLLELLPGQIASVRLVLSD